MPVSKRRSLGLLMFLCLSNGIVNLLILRICHILYLMREKRTLVYFQSSEVV